MDPSFGPALPMSDPPTGNQLRLEPQQDQVAAGASRPVGMTASQGHESWALTLSGRLAQAQGVPAAENSVNRPVQTTGAGRPPHVR